MHQTLPILFESIQKNKIPNTQIAIFVNESTDDNTTTINDITYHNCSELTYFEWIIPKLIIERNLKTDWWFLLHDTVILGDTFFEKVTNHDNRNNVSLLLSEVVSNNMGMVKQEIFSDHIDFVNYFKQSINTISKYTTALDRKKWIIEHENQYLRLYGSKTSAFYDYYHCEDTGVATYCNDNRYVEYFKNIDLYKMKKNNHPDKLTINL